MSQQQTSASRKRPTEDFEAVVVGTGFGGAVTACRLVEAGFSICVLERGRRYEAADFPKFPARDLFTADGKDDGPFAPPPDFSRWLWSRDRGIYDIRDLGDAVVVQAAGLGGGSLIYANVHLRPPRDLFSRGWPKAYRADGPCPPLEPYFDLAAYMLQVSPIPQRLEKTDQLQNAARATAAPDGHWFRTPLAVHFDAPSQQAGGHARPPCDMRGRCILGCDNQSKNTLDLNYLARAAAGTGGGTADIRTWSDVTTIERTDGGFIVTYQDLLFRDEQGRRQRDRRGRRHTVRAKDVFLCAGSVNTTELLLRNPALFRGTRPRALGSHYFPNADSLGAVFDCGAPHEADYGPTITSAVLVREPIDGPESGSLEFADGRVVKGGRRPVGGCVVRGLESRATATLVREPIADWGTWSDGAGGGVTGVLVVSEIDGAFKEDGEPLEIGWSVGDETRTRFWRWALATSRSGRTAREHWLLAEDGGFPPDLEPLVGIFRSPLWAHRNRYLEPSCVRPEPGGRARRSPSPSRDASATHPNVAAYANATGSAVTRAAPFSALGMMQGPSLTLLDLFQEQLSGFFPPFFVEALRDNRRVLVMQAAAMALPVVDRLLNELSRELATRLDATTASRLGLGELDGAKREMLVRGVLRQGLQVIAGGEVTVAQRVSEMLLESVATTGQLAHALSNVLLWALGYRIPEGHTGLVLLMGRDLYRGQLAWLDDPKTAGAGRLAARLPNARQLPSTVYQERVLRSIATAWGGELRSNPAWAAAGKHVTVHSQGGCPMGEDADSSVTDAWGQVHGCEGLYVMDGAAFPTSVGVNPSATIAAVAEFKIEHFIRRTRPGWKARDLESAVAWVNPQRASLDPLNPPSPSFSQAPRASALSLTFSERMHGFYSEIEGGAARLPRRPLRDRIRACRRAEDDGGQGGRQITAQLTATVVDLAALTSGERPYDPPRIRLGGTVTLDSRKKTGKEPSLEEIRESVAFQVQESGESFLQLFVRPLREAEPPTRVIRYRLLLRNPSECVVLTGEKVLRDEPGFDVLHDTLTVYFTTTGDRRLQGVLRVGLQDFLTMQMRSMDVVNTTDPVRKSWAFAAFLKYFAGELVAVYGGRADTLIQMLRSVLTSVNV